MKLIISRLEKLKKRAITPAVERLKPYNIKELLSLDDELFLNFCTTWGLVSKKKLVTVPIEKKYKTVSLPAVRQRRFRKKRKDSLSLVQIYIDKDLKFKFKIDCIRKNISMQDKINALISDYLVYY